VDFWVRADTGSFSCGPSLQSSGGTDHRSEAVPFRQRSRADFSQNLNGISTLSQAGERERGARHTHKRLLYCVNVNYTSLDHLLLGGNADIDKDVE